MGGRNAGRDFVTGGRGQVGAKSAVPPAAKVWRGALSALWLALVSVVVASVPVAAASTPSTSHSSKGVTYTYDAVRSLAHGTSASLSPTPVPSGPARDGSRSAAGTTPLHLRGLAVAANAAPRLNLARIQIKNNGVGAVERHLNRFVDPGGSLGSAEAGMLARLRKVAAGDIAPQAQDLRFYAHELRESVLYRQAGYPIGQPLGSDASYALWDRLHTQALTDYGIPRAIPGDFLYHPSVLGQ
jgi:hypothetical protein